MAGGVARGVLTGLAVLAVAALGLACLSGAADAAWATPGWWQSQQAALGGWQREAPITFLCGFALVFALLSACALPGCAPLALLAGHCFGGWLGTLVVGAASTLGALLPFLAARHVARGAAERRLGARLAQLDAAVARLGRWWLFWLRLVPVLPYPVLNPLLGLSRLSVGGFFWPSLAGLTLGSLPYVWAGVWAGRSLQAGEADALQRWAPLALAAAALLALAVLVRRARRHAAGASA